MNRALLCVLLLLSGCEVGPDYQRPQATDAPVPAFKELDGWKPATPADLDDRGAWWTVFGDPLLDQLELKVDVSNQTLRASLAAYEQAVAVADEARAQLFPTVAAAPTVSRAQGGATVSTGTISRTRTAAGLEVTGSWTVDLWGKLRRTVRSENEAAQASAADLANARLSVQAQLATDYFDLRAAEALAALLRETVAEYEHALNIVTNQYNAGAAARSDVITAQAQLQGARSALINTGVQRAQLDHAIAVLTGQPPAAQSIPPGGLTETVPVVPAGLPSELLERRPDVAAAERNMAAANEQIGIAIAAYYPTLSLSAQYGYAGSALATLVGAANRVWSLGAAASETLIDGGSRSATVRAARAAYDGTVADYRQTVLTAFQQVEDALSTLRILQDQYAVQVSAVQLAQQALDVTLNQYRAGTQPYTAVITAQNTLLSDRQTLVTLQQQRLVAAVGLIEAIGGGWQAGVLPQFPVL